MLKLPDSSHSRRSGGREARLAGRVIAITGAASGIGRAVAIACAERGATLALADLSPEVAQLAKELEAAGLPPSRMLVRKLDVTSRPDVIAWASEIEREFGGTDVVVNSAGVALHCPLDETTLEDFEWLMATNFWGTVHGTQAFLPEFERRGRGHIINLSSAFGLMAFPASGAYVASKFAVRGFTETLALELAVTHPGIHVTCVHPGGVNTPLVRRARVRGTGPLSRRPEEVAQTFERDLARSSAMACAERIVLAMDRRERRLLIGADARLIDWLVRLFPSFHGRMFSWVLRRASPPDQGVRRTDR